MKQPDIISRNALRPAAAIRNLGSAAAAGILQREATGNTFLRRTLAMRVAVAILYIFAGCLVGCSNEAVDPDATTSVPLLTVRAGIDAPLTRASLTTWSPGDAIGIFSENTRGEVRYNIKYITEKGDGVFIPAHPDTSIIIQQGGNVTTTLYAYYPFTGKNGELSSAKAEIKHTITPDDQAPDRQPLIDFLYARGTSAQSNVDLQFRHRMSRIVLNIEAGNGLDRLSDMTCTLRNVKIAGSFSCITGKMETDSTVPSADFSMFLPSGTTSASLLFYPQNSGHSIPFSIEMNGETYTTPGLPFTNGLESGMKYDFTITVSDRRIRVGTSSSGSWNEKEDTENVVSAPI